MKDWKNIIVLAIIIFGAYMMGTMQKKPINIDPETKRDTIVIREHIRDTIFEPETHILERRDTLMVQLPGDTTFVEITVPFELKTYRTDNYSLDISGIKPKLERIELFPETKIVTEYRTKTVIQPPSWQAGAIAGYQISALGSYEYVGARARYNFGALNIEGTAGYSFSLKSPMAEITIGIDLFR